MFNTYLGDVCKDSRLCMQHASQSIWYTGETQQVGDSSVLLLLEEKSSSLGSNNF